MKYSFEAESYTLKEISDSQLMELEIYVVSEGNNAHDMPILFSAIEDSAHTLIGKPILMKYDNITDDFEGHEIDEIACGVVLKEQDIRFEEKDGKRWLVCKAYIWKRYYEEVIEVFERDKIKSVSMEIEVVDYENMKGKKTISAYVYSGITLLGEKHQPAIENANASVVKFEEVKENIIKELDKLEQENLSDKTDSQKLDKKTYVNVNVDVEDLAKRIKNQLIKNWNINNLEKEECKDMAEKNKEVIFDKKEFASKIALTCQEILQKMYDLCMSIDRDEKYYFMNDYNEDYIFALKRSDYKFVGIPYSVEGEKFVLDTENIVSARYTFFVEEDNGGVEAFSSKIIEDTVNEKVDEKIKEFEAEKKEFEKEFEVEKTNLISEKEELTEKINKLEEFKKNVKEEEFKNKVEFEINEVSEDLEAEDIEEWRNKAKDYETVEKFANELKAFAYKKVKENKKNEQKEDDLTLGLTKAKKEKKSDSLWDKLDN
jgi:hypothetical protein